MTSVTTISQRVYVAVFTVCVSGFVSLAACIVWELSK